MFQKSIHWHAINEIYLRISSIFYTKKENLLVNQNLQMQTHLNRNYIIAIVLHLNGKSQLHQKFNLQSYYWTHHWSEKF